MRIFCPSGSNIFSIFENVVELKKRFDSPYNFYLKYFSFYEDFSET